MKTNKKQLRDYDSIRESLSYENLIKTKKITLKLTKSEYIELIRMWENSSYIHTDYNLIKILKDNESVEIMDIYKFKEFLSTEWNFWGNNDILKSIVSKLNKEVA